MKKKMSRKHHYLPRHYLHGFTNDEGNFFVYDKSSDKIRPTSPDDAFFENNLNTVILPGGNASDFLEDLYTTLENGSWPTLDRIRDSASGTTIQPLDKMNLYLFLLYLHWRLPSNIKFAEILSKDFFHGDNNFDYFQLVNKNGDTVAINVIEKIKELPAFKRSAKILVPLAPFFKDKNWSKNLENWHFIYPQDNKIWYMVGDNPVITRGNSDHDPINCLKEFIFPVSGNILLINGAIFNGNMLPPKFTVQYNLAIIKRAQRFVVCQRKDFLEALINLYKPYVQDKTEDSIITELFDMIKTGK